MPLSRGLCFSVIVYLTLSISGLFYGLPDQGRVLSSNCDETTWVEALSLIKAENHYNPHPHLMAPTGYLLMYGASVGVAAAAHYVPLHQSKEWFREHPEIFARFYLVGRLLQVVCGLLLMFGMWFVARATFGASVADIFAILLSVTPGFVSTSHFSQASMPVALFSNLSLGALIWSERQEQFRERWFYFAAALAGFALGTKLSALALAVPLTYYGWVFYRRSPKVLFLSVAAFGLGLILACPFALLSPSSFAAAIFLNQQDNQRPLSTVFQGLRFLFGVPLRLSLGGALEAVCCIATLFLIVRKTSFSVRLLMVWIAAFFMAVMRVGEIANTARIIVVVPALVLIAALVLSKTKRWVVAFLFLSTLVPTLGIVRSRWQPLLQEKSSVWIEQNVPAGSTIGIMRNPFWYSPDIVIQMMDRLGRYGEKYPIRVFDYSLDKLKASMPDFIVMSRIEKNRCREWGYPTDCFDTVRWVDQGDVYEVAKIFPREIVFHGFRWNRPEYDQYPLYDDHDLWASSIYVYKRKSAP